MTAIEATETSLAAPEPATDPGPLCARIADLEPAPPPTDRELRAVMEWLAKHERIRSRHTEVAYARDLGQWRAFLHAHYPGVGLDQASGTTVAAYRRWLDQPHQVTSKAGDVSVKSFTETTKARKLATLGSFYGFSCEAGRWMSGLSNPVDDAGRRKGAAEPGRRTGSLDPESIAAMAKAARPPVRALIGLLASTGMRVSEALGGTHGDVRNAVGARVLHVVGKGRKERDVVVADEVWAAISALTPRPSKDAPLIPGRGGGPMGYGEAAYGVLRAARDAGLPRRVTPHQLRASYATIAHADLDQETSAIAAQLGHSSDKMTRRYIHADRTVRVGAVVNTALAAGILGDAANPAD